MQPPVEQASESQAKIAATIDIKINTINRDSIESKMYYLEQVRSNAISIGQLSICQVVVPQAGTIKNIVLKLNREAVADMSFNVRKGVNAFGLATIFPLADFPEIAGGEEIIEKTVSVAVAEHEILTLDFVNLDSVLPSDQARLNLSLPLTVIFEIERL